MYLCNFVIISQCKKMWPFHFIKLKFSLPWDVFAKFGWNWPNVSGGEFFFKSSIYFRNYLLFEKDGTFHLNKFESPTPQDDLWQVWLKLAQWFWKGWFFKFVYVFSQCTYYLPLEINGPIWRNVGKTCSIFLWEIHMYM